MSDLGTTNIIESHKQIKALLLELGRIESRWDQLTAETFKIEDIIMNLNSPNQRIESTLSISSKYDCVNYLRWFWLCRLKLIVIPALAVLFSLFAAAVVIAEIAVFWPTVSFLNPFCHLLKLNTFISLDCSLLFVLTYIAFCVYYALFKLKFTSYYGLYWNKQTDASSLIFYAMYF